MTDRQWKNLGRAPKTKKRVSGSRPAIGSAILDAAENMDWMQVVLNQGPPCFHLQGDGSFCGRAKRWAGHDGPDEFHKFISLADLLRSISPNDRDQV